MATYLQAQLGGVGVVGGEMNGSHTFTITKHPNSRGRYEACYLIIEGSSRANPSLLVDQNVEGVFSAQNGVVDIIYHALTWGVLLDNQAVSTFTFTVMPLQVIPQGSYFIRGCGNFDLHVS